MIDMTVQLPILMAVMEIEDISVTDEGAGYQQLQKCADRYRKQCSAQGITTPGSVPGVQRARSLFRALGIDPTKYRPSSEKLLNRVLKGKSLPKVNTLVDVGNACSLSALLPIGIYDRQKLQGVVVLRKGGVGESYIAIGGSEMNLEGRYTLVDESGPFGSPITDSTRTCVTEETCNTAWFVYAPSDDDPEQFEHLARQMVEDTIAVCGGQLTSLVVVKGED